jgi:hypothetical protein
MYDAGGGDDLVGGVAVKIQSFDRTADIERQWPSLNARQCSGQLRVVKSTSMRSNSESLAISQRTIAEMLQVSLESKARSRAVKSSAKA